MYLLPPTHSSCISTDTAVISRLQEWMLGKSLATLAFRLNGSVIFFLYFQFLKITQGLKKIGLTRNPLKLQKQRRM